MRNVIKRSEYTPPNYWIESVELTFDLHPHQTQVINTMRIVRNHEKPTAPLVLNGEHLTLKQIVLNGKLLDTNEFLQDAHSLTINDVPDHFELTITTIIHPDKNTTLEGLYISNDIFCTQCEAHGFRCITYFLDRPDVMTFFKTKIIADKHRYPRLLSNGNLIETGDLEDDKHYAIWHDPFKKPCYLFALVAGNLDCLEDHFITQSGRDITLRIYVEKGMRERCHHAMESLKLAMRWDEEKYGREYDLDIFMIVAVSDFNMGAMENKGLNIFNAKYILADPESATDIDYESIQIVVGHEYFHNWTGNRITCRDWFQLSLKEGLTVFRDQEFNADITSRAISRIDDVVILRASQFPEDAGPLAHPVRPDSYIEVNNFYTATVYNKGAEVIRMMQTLLTPEGFRRGMDLYFERHDGQAVTCDDYAQALADANHVDLTQFKRWYSQAGTPVIKVEQRYLPHSHQFELTLTQSCPATPDQLDKLPMHIPVKVALFDENGNKLWLGEEQKERTLELKHAAEIFTFSNIAKPPILSILRNFSAPVKLEFTRPISDYYTLLKHDDDAFNRWEAAQELGFHMLDVFIDAYQNEHQYKLDERYIDALYHALKSTSQDPALSARILMLPSLQQMSERYQSNMPVEAITIAHATLRETLAIRLYDLMLTTYKRLNQHQTYQFNATEAGRRSLKNACLYYLVHSDNEEGLALAIEQYHFANNMTDRLAALSLIVNCENDSRSILLEDFYNRWHHDSLVMDKWFALQSTSELVDVLDNVKSLLQHPAFSYKNPNKVRALIGAFAMNNFAHFNAMDGSGYFFLAEQVCLIDKINPQIAARIVTPLTRWQPQQPLRQELMQDALNRILAEPKLSNNVYEIVSKSLPVTV